MTLQTPLVRIYSVVCLGWVMLTEGTALDFWLERFSLVELDTLFSTCISWWLACKMLCCVEFYVKVDDLDLWLVLMFCYGGVCGLVQ